MMNSDQTEANLPSGGISNTPAGSPRPSEPSKLRTGFNTDAFHTRLAYLGLAVDVLIPTIFFALGLFLRSSGQVLNKDKPPLLPAAKLQLLWIVLLIVSVADIALGLIIRWRMLKPVRAAQKAQKMGLRIEQTIQRGAIAIYVICLAPALYGLLFYLLGGTVEQFVTFIAITLVAYQLLRPRPGLIDELLRGSRAD